jgi:hypothetical protein
VRDEILISTPAYFDEKEIEEAEVDNKLQNKLAKITAMPCVDCLSCYCVCYCFHQCATLCCTLPCLDMAVVAVVVPVVLPRHRRSPNSAAAKRQK